MDILKQFEIAFEAAPSAILIVDTDGNIALTNSTLDTLFEYGHGELLGQSVERLVPDEVRSEHPELRNAYLHLPYSRKMGVGRDLFGVTKFGKLIPVEIGLNFVDSGDENYVVASVLDISGRKKQEERTRLAINAAASAMIMTDAKSQIVLANAQACEVFGYALEELIGEPVEKLLPSKLRRRHAVYRTSFLSNPSQRDMGRGRDLFGCRKDGTEFPLEIGLTPIESDGERFIMATIIDITQRKAVEEEIRSKNRDLTRLNQELAQFAYSASHDLKAPLATLEGVLSCIEMDSEDNDLEAVRENAKRARAQTAKLKRLIEDILGLARAENLDDEYQEVCLDKLVQKALGVVEATLVENDIRTEIDVPDGLSICSEPTRVAQILENLIGNAAKFSDRNKPDSYVRIAAKRENGMLKLVVEDNGVGIPRDGQKDVFKLFKRFGNHPAGGTGLGLALVKQHVERLRGSISFDSTPEGTCFSVRLPMNAKEREHEAH